MANLMEHVEYLSKEIGPRPAGTEEEQQAALYIAEQFQKDSGFSVQIEDFACTSGVETLAIIPGLVVIVAGILTISPLPFDLPAFVLALLACVLYVPELLGQPIVSRLMNRGASQNVVAKYQPAAANADPRGRSRSRKVILVAHYDTGKVTPALVKRVESLKLPLTIDAICAIAMIAAVVLMLIHLFANAGIPGIIVNVLLAIALIVCAYIPVRAILRRIAPYNEGANNNATGTAALLEVARRISRGSMSEADLANAGGDVRIHGEAAARESGLVPEGAQIRYEAEQLVPPAEIGEYDEEERLLAAKAAIAALTGQPVERRVYGSVAGKLVNSRVQVDAGTGFGRRLDDFGAEHESVPEEAEPFDAEFEGNPSDYEEANANVADELVNSVEEASQKSQVTEVGGFQNAPSWFVAAQQNAKRPTGEADPIQRSRYADAIEAAEREAAEREQEREAAERAEREDALRARGEAARAAIASSGTAYQADQQQDDIDDEFAPIPDWNNRTEPGQAPEAVAEPEPAPAETADRPGEDAFAESLGSTTVFNPLSLAELGLADGSGGEEDEPRNQLSSLPSISAPNRAVPENENPSRSGLFRKLRVDVPSMSGVIRMQEAGEDVSQLPQPANADIAQVAAQAPVVVPTPAAPAPGHEPAHPLPPQAVTDDVDYNMEVSVDGLDSFDPAPAYQPAPRADSADDGDYAGYDDVVEEKPRSGFLGRFRRKPADYLEEETPQEWLDVDEDFEAREVGRRRGSWESFREEPSDDYGSAGRHASPRQWEGGSYSREHMGYADTDSAELAEGAAHDSSSDSYEDQIIAGEIEQIYHFRNPLYGTEIWFVALGADNFSHDGAKALMAEHGDDLRGAMVIEVESLGAGELCVASSEGRVLPAMASSRAKRYTRTASAATGITPGSVDLAGTDSAAYALQAAGHQSMHLLGVEDGRPALKGSADDVLENVDELLLDDNVNFLMELLKK